MKRSRVAAATALLAAACSGSSPAEDPETAFRETCTFVLSDESLSRDLATISTTPDIACDCLQSRIDDNERQYALVMLFLKDVASEMDASDIGAEAAARQLSMFAPLPGGAAAEEDNFTDAMPAFSRAFGPLLREIAANDGQCPASDADAR